MTAEFVSEESCSDRHKGTWRLVSALLVITVLMATGVGWSLLAGYGAAREASNASQAIEVHAAGEAEKNNAIRDSLTRIEAEQRRMRELLDQLLQARGE